MKVTIICGSPGAGMSKAALDIDGLLPDSSRTVDLDEKLIEAAVLSSDKAFDGLDSSSGLPELCTRTRGPLHNLWRSVVSDVLRETADNGYDHLALYCHLTYFNRDRLEFYSPFNLNPFLQSEAELCRVVLLIDDLYDSWARLPNLYDPKVELAGVALPSEKLHQLDPSDDDLSALLGFEARLRSFTEILHWRRSETIQAESVSRQLDVPLSIVGVKHRTADVAHLVSGAACDTVYISHQISSPRRDKHKAIESGEEVPWSDFVDEVGQFASTISDDDLIPIMPTAIDELRWFCISGERVHDLARLTPRWPLMGEIENLLYNQPEVFSSPDAYESVDEVIRKLSTVTPEVLTSAAASARSFERTVFHEIAFRDHMIVENTTHLLAYRPFADLDESYLKWSSGVQSEILHHNECRDNGESHRRLLVIHTADDLVASKADIFRRVGGQLLQHAAAHQDIRSNDLNVVKEYIREGRGRAQHLDRKALYWPDDPQKVVRQAFGSALSDVLSGSTGVLTGAGGSRLDTAVVVVWEKSELVGLPVITQLRNFLKSGSGSEEICTKSWNVMMDAFGTSVDKFIEDAIANWS